MRSHSISIWFFIGIDLLVSGILIAGAGLYELWVPPQHPVTLFYLHANLWWGAAMVVVGGFYTVRFAPKRVRDPEPRPVEAKWR